MASSSSYQGDVQFGKTVIQEGSTFRVKPLALDIVLGMDPRYWNIPQKDRSKGSEPVGLLRVSWLEVTSSLNLRNLMKGCEYAVNFKVSMKTEAFGWTDCPVYLIPEDKTLNFRVPEDAADDDKLLFGIYEIWKGKWKGGLVIHEVVIAPVNFDGIIIQ